MREIGEKEYLKGMKKLIETDLKVERNMIERAFEIDPIDSEMRYVQSDISRHAENIMNNNEYVNGALSKKRFYDLTYNTDGLSYGYQYALKEKPNDMFR